MVTHARIGDVQVVVAFHVDAEGRPSGTVRTLDGAAAGFVGWLSLTAELHRLAVHASGTEGNEDDDH